MRLLEVQLRVIHSFITFKRLKMSNMRSFLVMESSEKHLQTEILSKFRILRQMDRKLTVLVILLLVENAHILEMQSKTP